ncbi:FAD-binding protein [Kluyvera sp. STS39-E]|uniref:FAD-binding protein n=1 Tax=Kluyvera sp. STS39-E TaxID=3234748 RepID=UPI0034C6150E
MTIAVVLLDSADEQPLASFIADSGLTESALIGWRLPGDVFSIPAILSALETQYYCQIVETIVFPASIIGDELATRLAWRLGGSSVCQVETYSPVAHTLSKAVYGNALYATLRASNRPLCLSASRNRALRGEGLPAAMPTLDIVVQPTADPLPAPEILAKTRHPLNAAKVVLATGLGAQTEIFDKLATELNAELGFTRQRVMAGGCDEQRMIGISGLNVAPEICIIAGASGASAFMAGVQQSGFIVAVNNSQTAPIFAAADVGIVGDAEAVLTALVDCMDD